MTILKANSYFIDRKIGEIWTGQTLLQPISFKSDRLLAYRIGLEVRNTISRMAEVPRHNSMIKINNDTSDPVAAISSYSTEMDLNCFRLSRSVGNSDKLFLFLNR